MRLSRLIIGCALLLVCFSSCRPRGVLSRSEMVDVLFDMHLTEAAVQEQYGMVTPDWTKGIDESYFRDLAYHSVLRKYKLSEEDFIRSIRWYSRRLNKFDKVYGDLMVRMDAFEKDIDSGKYDPFVRNAAQTADTARIRRIYTEGLFRKDTLLRKERICLMGDTTPTWSFVTAKEWVYPIDADLIRINLIPEGFVAAPAVPSVSDSLAQVADSLKRVQQAIEDEQPSFLQPGQQHPALNQIRRRPPSTFRDPEATEEMRDRLRQRAQEKRVIDREQARQIAMQRATAARIATEEKAARDKAAAQKKSR